MNSNSRTLRLSRVALAAVVVSLPALAQHSQVASVVPHPLRPTEAWLCNRDNGTVAIVDTLAGQLAAEIPVGVYPRSIAITPDGARAFVANQRGNVPVEVNFVTPFTGTEVRGTVSVIDVATRTVTHTLGADQVGVEPYGVAVSADGKWFAVSGFRSGTFRLFDALTLKPLASLQYLNDLSVIPAGKTAADVDANRDGVPDLGEPRGFTLREDGRQAWVTHNRSPFLSVLDIALDPQTSLPSGVSVAATVDTNEYPFDPFFNPTPVRSLKSQGVPRFLEDVALSPDGSRAVVPHLLHNVNHDVNHDFGPGLVGDFANRVYPALTMVDANKQTYGVPGDASNRLHHELSDTLTPAEFVPFGDAARNTVGFVTLGGEGSPVLGGSLDLRVTGMRPGETAQVWIGRRMNVPMGGIGTLHVRPRALLNVTNGTASIPLPNVAALDGAVLTAQAAIFNQGKLAWLSNGLEIVLGTQGFGADKLGYRAGHPGRVVFSEKGDRLLMLNRGSEDLFLYDVAGSSFELRTVYPPRHGFVERAALDTATPLGDLPLGMAVVPDASTRNDDALVYIQNELTRTLTVLRVDWQSGVILRVGGQIPTHAGPDVFTPSEILGNELFEDASRPQTAGNFNNSCASCHFEGGEDANVWQRPDGPRTTMPVYGGSLATGLMLWRGVRLHMGETGPMFGGENGGHGTFTKAEQQALIDWHAKIPVPLNPHLDPLTGQYSALAALGRDLFFGDNQTGLNPTLRHAGCAECHPDTDAVTGQTRGYTADFLNPLLTSGTNFGALDPNCFSLRENIVAPNIRDVNSGCNIDVDGDGFPDMDRNKDGYVDIETYAIMNLDTDSDFTRDDPNSYDCPLVPGMPGSPLRVFSREKRLFSIPTKLGVFSTGPYFHDHSAFSLRMIVDPEAQSLDPVYGDPAYGPLAPTSPGLLKFFNEFHDVRGHEQFVPKASKVQLTLNSTNVQNDIEALLAYIQSL